jgi:3-oxoadipate enol-lactonase
MRLTADESTHSEGPSSARQRAGAHSVSSDLDTLLRRVLDVRKMAQSRSRTSAVNVVPSGIVQEPERFQSTLARVAGVYGAGDLRLAQADASRTNVDIAISRCLDVGASLQLSPRDSSELQYAIDEIRQEAVDVRFHQVELTQPDGAVLTTYTSGNRASPPIVIVTPTGMPIELSQNWLSVLGRHHFVIAWESRALFHLDEPFERMEHSLEAQVGDIFAVMDHYGVQSANLMAFCVGTISALKAAADRPDRITKLVLGNGFYSLPGVPKTPTESQLLQASLMSSKSRTAAARMQAMFLEPAFLPSLDRLAHWTLYPYSDAELLYRYGRLCTALHQADKGSWLPSIRQETLVITGLEDTVVHPEGSCALATRLPNARLQEEPGDDHLGVFLAGSNYREAVLSFFQKR